jgi:hypothetical protein
MSRKKLSLKEQPVKTGRGVGHLLMRPRSSLFSVLGMFVMMET